MNNRNVADIIEAIVADHRRSTRGIRRRLAEVDARAAAPVPVVEPPSTPSILRRVTDPDVPRREANPSRGAQRPASWLS